MRYLKLKTNKSQTEQTNGTSSFTVSAVFWHPQLKAAVKVGPEINECLRLGFS